MLITMIPMFVVHAFDVERCQSLTEQKVALRDGCFVVANFCMMTHNILQ